LYRTIAHYAHVNEQRFLKSARPLNTSPQAIEQTRIVGKAGGAGMPSVSQIFRRRGTATLPSAP
jgi:hypothetical protein